LINFNLFEGYYICFKPNYIYRCT